MSEPKPWKHPKYDVMNLANDDFVLASIAKLYKSEMLLAVAEVERLRAENARLKAEVERLRNLDIKLESKIDPLLAQIERLTEAGDAMADSWLDGIRAVNWEAKDVKKLRDWYAAKEGKGHE